MEAPDEAPEPPTFLLYRQQSGFTFRRGAYHRAIPLAKPVPREYDDFFSFLDKERTAPSGLFVADGPVRHDFLPHIIKSVCLMVYHKKHFPDRKPLAVCTKVGYDCIRIYPRVALGYSVLQDTENSWKEWFVETLEQKFLDINERSHSEALLVSHAIVSHAIALVAIQNLIFPWERKHGRLQNQSIAESYAHTLSRKYPSLYVMRVAKLFPPSISGRKCNVPRVIEE